MSLREVVVAALIASATPAGARAEALGLTRAVQLALAHDAGVRAAEAEVRAARARLAGASIPLASNPELSAAAGRRSGDDRRTPEYEVELSQRIDVAGQRGARIAAARAAVGAAEARVAASRARVAADVRELLGRVAAASLRAEVAAEAQALAEQGVSAAERRLGAGDAARVEVTTARLERGRALRAVLEADGERSAALADLELLLALEPGAAPPEIAFELGSGPRADAPRDDELVREALAARRDLAAARLDVTAAEAEVALARRSAVPSPSLGVSVAREEGADVVLGTLAFALPLFERNQEARGVTSARLEQGRVALAALERRIGREVRLAAERVRSARRAVDAFDPETVAAARDGLALATDAYERGQLDLVRYLLLRREAIDARRDRIDALEALNRAEAELERTRGAAGEAPGPAAAAGR
jgi:cobalt-zinc-cadmium efflux system outer membrane protein